jgi:hypothetical protein
MGTHDKDDSDSWVSQQAIKLALPDGGERPPGDVLNYRLAELGAREGPKSHFG